MQDISTYLYIYIYEYIIIYRYMICLGIYTQYTYIYTRQQGLIYIQIKRHIRSIKHRYIYIQIVIYIYQNMPIHTHTLVHGHNDFLCIKLFAQGLSSTLANNWLVCIINLRYRYLFRTMAFRHQTCLFQPCINYYLKVDDPLI